ncbi:PREDICTED: protein YIPF6-like [Acropora digitifera]|uniref:protein YIPF6-like n=1 Tax=Acropora digitifera TaxID=70779 RepID=UPI00077A47C4|nr:PREDICTED: protein YIPF6-like [Acropora digitifera]
MASEQGFVPTSVNVEIEGDITVPGAPEEDEGPSTLDEPVAETLKRDLRAVGKKFFHVLIPRQSKSLLRDWDLWGPLILCVLLAMMLQGHAVVNSTNDGGPQFAEVFVVVWVGSLIITVNSKLLGGTISFFQSVCVLGYCILPLNVALIVCRLILLAKHTTALFIVRFIVVILGFAWSTFASVKFLGDSQPNNRKALAVYPIGLFYFVIGWMIISHSG